MSIKSSMHFIAWTNRSISSRSFQFRFTLSLSTYRRGKVPQGVSLRIFLNLASETEAKLMVRISLVGILLACSPVSTTVSPAFWALSLPGAIWTLKIRNWVVLRFLKLRATKSRSSFLNLNQRLRRQLSNRPSKKRKITRWNLIGGTIQSMPKTLQAEMTRSWCIELCTLKTVLCSWNLYLREKGQVAPSMGSIPTRLLIWS